ncbi:Aminotransferase-like [Vigna unguiculata]|uniref:Aminotransferase-like n=1 Tax=Vigna unguiculata TaxID=3917 RepID=A0A4D6N6L7_VIGUN|nr:Aminotransferase-like [Vigna unguiculata]
MSSKRERKCIPEAGNKGKKKKVVENVDQVRIVHRCESKYIVEVNNVLKATHRKRIQATPFRWCLEVDNTLEINCPLLREVLRRWVPQGEYIRVGQHLVGLSVYDVCVCLGLSMVGKCVEFDDDVSGVVGSLFEKKPITLRDIIKKIKNLVVSDDDVENACRLYLLLCFTVFYFPRTSRTVTNMPFKVLDNVDNLSEYNWAESVHSFLISALNRGCKVVREKINTRSLNLAGSVVVVQVWAARRLGLEDVEGEVQFPRFLRWPSVKIRTPNIESAFEKNKIVFGWALTAEERNNPIVQNVVHIDEQYNVNNDGIQGVSHSKQQVDLEEKFEKHERMILDMKEQIKKMREEFFDAPEPDSCAGKGNDVNEEDRCPSEQWKSNEGQACPSHRKESPQPHQCEEDDLNDKPKANHNGDDKAIKPNTEGQSNTLFIDKAKLYKDVTAVGCPRTIYVDLNGEILRSDECQCFRPCGWIDNMSIMFAAYEFMYKQKMLTGKISRVIFNPFYTNAIILDCNKRKVNRRELCLDDYRHYLTRDLVSVQDILTADFVQNVENLFWLFLHDKNKLKPTFEVHIEDVPEQPNFIMVLKYLEIWDGIKRCDGKSMPAYTDLFFGGRRIYNNSGSSTFVTGFFNKKLSIGRLYLKYLNHL